MSVVCDWRQLGAWVYEVTRHNEVIRAWGDLKRDRKETPYLVTLDKHTDTRDAFHDAAIEDGASGVALSKWSNPLIKAIEGCESACLRAAIPLLDHDEHIDAARQAGIIQSPVFLLQSATIGITPTWLQAQQFDASTTKAAAMSIEPVQISPFIPASGIADSLRGIPKAGNP
ncbi:hypothetical protein GAY28_24875 [Azospirillum brasilense]|nr:hypothetical protein [Azospirillum brasilense]